jgi:hypothetical protein
MERTAKKLFNADMDLYNVYAKLDEATGRVTTSQEKSNGAFKVTSEYLSSLAQEDLPKAIELLSSLQVNGYLGVQTMNKLFNVDTHSRNTMSKVA